MLEAIKKYGNIAYTQNGAVSNAYTTNACLDFFSVAGALRTEDEKRIISLFTRAFISDPDYALRALFYARDVRGGCGERRVFRIILKWLASEYPETVRKNIANVPEYGRYDDIFELIGTPCESDAISFIDETLKSDTEKIIRGERASLLAKWMPSVNASNKERKVLARYIIRKLGITEKDYRKSLSALRKHIDILERRLCERDYTFLYSLQPAKAMLKYRKAFLKNDGIRYTSYLRSVRNINTSALYPYEIIEEVIKSGMSNAEIDVLEAMWYNLQDYCNNRNAIAVVDGSASMIGRPLNIAVSLGMYFAERNTGFFRNHFITFSKSPQLVEICDSNIRERALQCMSYCEGDNTDLIRVFGLILKAAIKNKLSQEELPETIYVISDMEFDNGVSNSISLFKEARQLFEKHGYKLPQIVYWNVDSKSQQTPVTSNEYGAVLVSGTNPAVFSMVMSQNVSPLEFMKSVLNSERYRNIYA